MTTLHYCASEARQNLVYSSENVKRYSCITLGAHQSFLFNSMTINECGNALGEGQVNQVVFLQSFKVDIVANPQLSLGIPGAVVVLKVRGGWQISMMVPQPAMSNAASWQLWNLWSQKLTNLILFHLFEYFKLLLMSHAIHECLQIPKLPHSTETRTLFSW